MMPMKVVEIFKDQELQRWGGLWKLLRPVCCGGRLKLKLKGS